MKKIIIYFSQSGKTRVCAEAIGKELDANVREIIPKKQRRGPMLYIIGGFEALLKKKVELLNPNYDLFGYDKIILASPTWAGQQTPAIYTFAANADFGNKKVILFTTSMDKPEKVENSIKSFIEKPGVEFLGKTGVQCIRKNNEEIAKEAVERIKGIGNR